jgi:hypothetical protein
MSEHWVRGHMAVVRGLKEKTGVFSVRFCYRPEPLSAEAATRILCQKGVFVLALNAYCAAVAGKSCGQIATDAIGDVMMAT